MPQYNGVWTLEQQAQAQSNQQWVTDPNFRNTTLLLQADGTGSGSQNNTFLDGSTNNFYVTRNGNTTQGSFTPFSQAPGRWSTYFGASTSSYVSAPYNASQFVFSTNSFTMEFFVYFNAFVNDSKFIIQYDGSSYWQFRYDTTNGIQFVNNGTITATQGNTSGWSTNVWYHVALVRSGSTFTIYRDGVVVATGTSASAINNNSNAVTIGGNPNAGGSSQNAYMSNVRVLNGTALYSGTSTSVANFAVPNSPFTTTSGGASNCVLLTCQSNRWVDNSSFNSALTVANSPSVQAFSPFAPQFQWTPAVIGGSGYFDGSGDYLTFGSGQANANLNGDCSIELWFYPTGAAAAGLLTAKYGGTTNQFYINSQSNNLIYAEFLGSTFYAKTSTSSFTRNAWNHLLITKSSTTAKMWLNGFYEGAWTVSTTNSSTDAIGVGATQGGATTFSGYISGIRYSNTATETGTSNITLPTAPLTSNANTAALLSFTNAGIYDGTMGNILETIGNTQVSTSVVKYGSGSLRLNGTTDYLNFPVPQSFYFGTGDFTVEMWANFSSISTSTVLIGNFNNNTTAFGIWTLYWYSTGNLAFFCLGGTAYQVAWTPVPNTWYHIAVSRANSRLRWFINGVQTGATFASTDNLSFASGLTQPGGWNIGRSNDGAAYFNGYMDDIRVTPGVARYIANFTPPQQALPRQ